MKVSISQISGFVKSAEILSDFVEEYLSKTPVDQRAPLQKIVSAATTVNQMADSFMSAEVKISG